MGGTWYDNTLGHLAEREFRVERRGEDLERRFQDGRGDEKTREETIETDTQTCTRAKIVGEERHETYCEVERDDRERRDVEWKALY